MIDASPLPRDRLRVREALARRRVTAIATSPFVTPVTAIAAGRRTPPSRRARSRASVAGCTAAPCTLQVAGRPALPSASCRMYVSRASFSGSAPTARRSSNVRSTALDVLRPQQRIALLRVQLEHRARPLERVPREARAREPPRRARDGPRPPHRPLRRRTLAARALGDGDRRRRAAEAPAVTPSAASRARTPRRAAACAIASMTGARDVSRSMFVAAALTLAPPARWSSPLQRCAAASLRRRRTASLEGRCCASARLRVFGFRLSAAPSARRRSMADGALASCAPATLAGASPRRVAPLRARSRERDRKARAADSLARVSRARARRRRVISRHARAASAPEPRATRLAACARGAMAFSCGRRRRRPAARASFGVGAARVGWRSR